MSKESILIFLGLFVAAIPFVGIPDAFRTALFVVLGILIAFLALLLYARQHLSHAMKHSPAKRRRGQNTAGKTEEKLSLNESHSGAEESEEN